MTWGLSATNLANPWLNSMRGAGNGTSFTAPATLFDQLHTGDPGASGTANVSSVTTRVATGWAAASVGSMAMSGTSPAWATWAGTNAEVVFGVSTWSASTAGTFYHSTEFTAHKTVNTGDTLTLTSHSFALAPIAA
jgi:hypothetical protein